jgi:hypothetical protein
LKVFFLCGRTDPANGLGGDIIVKVGSVGFGNDFDRVNIHKLELSGENIVIGFQFQQRPGFSRFGDICAGDKFDTLSTVRNFFIKVLDGFA